MGVIDIEHIIKEGDSRLLKRLPRFVIKIIAKIIRQNELNEIIDKFSDYEGADFARKAIEHIDVKVDIEGLENLPDDGRCFFVANHAFGLLDGMILLSTTGEKYGEIRATGNEVIALVPNLQSVIINISVFGKNPKKYFVELNKLFASDFPITHFPFGFVSRISKLKVQDKFWKKSFITKAILNKRDVVPIKICGRNSNLFYAIYIFRQIFRIKTNIELVLLPREFFRKRGKTIKVKIGKPIHYQEFNDTLKHWDWAQKVRLLVYDL